MKKGFTLVELLAVIVILAIVAVIAAPMVINTINGARTSADERTIENIKSAVELAYTQARLKENSPSLKKLLEVLKENGISNVTITDEGLIKSNDGTIIAQLEEDNGKLKIAFNDEFESENETFNQFNFHILVGDVNGDGKINLSDDVSLRQYIEYSNEYIYYYDIYPDKIINKRDACTISLSLIDPDVFKLLRYLNENTQLSNEEIEDVDYNNDGIININDLDAAIHGCVSNRQDEDETDDEDLDDEGDDEEDENYEEPQI